MSRAFRLSEQLSGTDLAEVGYLLLADLPVIGVLGLLAWVEAVLPRAWKLVALMLTVVLFAVYLADALVVFSLNARLQLSDIPQFGPEWWLVRSFVSVSSVAMLVMTIASLFVTRSVTAGVARAVLVGALVLALVPLAVNEQSIPAHLQKYTGSVLLLAKELRGFRRLPVSRYRDSDVEAYRQEYDALFDAPIARTRKDIVLVIVESLSSADSHRTSGLRNILPRFDALSRKGMLFRNFFANFEASEGGIVSLLSGVPPLHFPTATTDTFGEYSRQGSITTTFRRSGYHTEFLTSVPLQFISMDTYTRSPVVGFAAASGQREIGRFTDAPRYAFESPPDHLLYEELLARLDRSRSNGQPVFTAAVTASSHLPYVDPLGKGDTEENAWAYVQEELWWLHGQLEARGFFKNGLLLITGDHRKMVPVQQAERERFGASAKARVPLLVIGAGVPEDVLDDRPFQQADLLRMLDRALQPGVELSPFVVWVERYVCCLGIASNASNLEVLDTSNGARRAFRMRLRGAEIEWLDRPPNALALERAVHRQRAVQQAVRASSGSRISVSVGRELKPSAQRGILLGLSRDADPSREPDDPRAGLRVFTTGSFDLEKVLSLASEADRPFTVTARAFLTVPADGEYWFSVFASGVSCLAIDKEIVLGCQSALNQGATQLAAGTHRLDLRFVVPDRKAFFRFEWLRPGDTQFTTFPQSALILPETGD